LTLNAPKPQFHSFRYDTPGDETHRIEIRTVGEGKVRILGIVADHTGTDPGVAYDTLGINGARAARLLGWNAEAFKPPPWPSAKPDLIILAYGTNESETVTGPPPLPTDRRSLQFCAVCEAPRPGVLPRLWTT
jgi:hypothetical protein